MGWEPKLNLHLGINAVVMLELKAALSSIYRTEIQCLAYTNMNMTKKVFAK